MALKMNYELPAGTNLNAIYPDFECCMKDKSEILENAYIKVYKLLEGTKNYQKFIIGVFVGSNSELIYPITLEFAPSTEDNAPNIIKQCYEYVKTLPKFATAIDC